MGSLGWVARRARRRRMGGLVGPFEEIRHPAAHRSRLAVEVQEDRMVPMPSADEQEHGDRLT